jgi:hypothetical protein
VALTIVAAFPVLFSVIGDNINVTLDVDVTQDPYNVVGTIKRVQDLVVTGIPGLTATRVFTTNIVTLTFSAPFTGIANVRFTVLT